MSKKGFKCPNCESQYCSAVRFWRDGKQIDSFDLYACHDCQQITDPTTMRAVSGTEEPPRKLPKGAGQVDIFGNIANPRAVIRSVPRLVESPAGDVVVTYRIYSDYPKVLREELKKMASEMQKGSSGRVQPFWYKYRKIQRGRQGTKK